MVQPPSWLLWRAILQCRAGGAQGLKEDVKVQGLGFWISAGRFGV